MILKENMLLKLDKQIYRIVDFDTRLNNVFLIDMYKERWPQVVNRNVLDEHIKKEIVNVFESNEYNIFINDEEITKLMIEKRDLAYEVILYIYSLSDEYEIYYSKSRGAIINEVINKYNISYSSVKKYLVNYLKAGKYKNGLIPKFYLCGGRGKDKKIVNKNISIGRRKNNGDNIVNVDEVIKRYFKKGINSYYNTKKQNTLTTTYELTIRDYLKDYPDAQIPTLRQFRYWYEKFSKDNKRNEISKRFGDRIYQQKGREIIGSSLSDSDLGPGTLYQIDSTILDVYIVSRLNRNLIVGRPVLYFVIDVYSRMIVGINVTVEPFNSYTGVMEALINAMTDKQSYCAKFGIDINKEEWDVKCIPQKILADRGELLSGHIENAICNLGILIQNTPPYRGDYKGIVEKSFEQLHAKIKPFVEGYVENGVNKVDRGAEDYRLKANLTLEEVTKIIIKCVLFHNNYHVLSSYITDELTIKENIPKIPAKIWEHGIKTKKGLLREMEEDIIKVSLLTNKEATVTAKGLRFNKLYYVSAFTLEEGWYQKARISGSFKVRVSYDPTNLSTLYYIKPGGNSYDILALVDYMSKYKNMSEEEINKIMQYEDSLNDKAKQNELKEKIKLFEELESITNIAKVQQEKVKITDVSKSSRLKGIQENLEQEREINKKIIDIKGNDMLKEVGLQEEQKVDELELFEEIQEDEWGDYYE